MTRAVARPKVHPKTGTRQGDLGNAASACAQEARPATADASGAEDGEAVELPPLTALALIGVSIWSGANASAVPVRPNRQEKKARVDPHGRKLLDGMIDFAAWFFLDKSPRRRVRGRRRVTPPGGLDQVENMPRLLLEPSSPQHCPQTRVVMLRICARLMQWHAGVSSCRT